jgi:hypothetical protein
MEPSYIAVSNPYGGPVTTLANGTTFPVAIEVPVYVLPDDAGPHLEAEERTIVTVGLEVRDGRPVATRVTVEHTANGVRREALSPTMLSDLNFGRIIEAATYGAGFEAMKPHTLEESWAAAAAGMRVAELANRRRQVTDSLLARVATIARDNPDAPGKAVADQEHVSRRQASRYMAAARKRGLLDQEEGDQ